MFYLLFAFELFTKYNLRDVLMKTQEVHEGWHLVMWKVR